MLNLNKALISLLTLKAYKRSNRPIIDECLSSMTLQLCDSLDSCLDAIRLDSRREDDDIDDDDDDGDDEAASDDTDEDSDYDIRFYLNLLMNLSPSMEQVYSQAVKEEGATTSMVFGDTQMPHIAHSFRLSMGTDGEENQGQFLGVGPASLSDGAFCKSLRERFTEVIQKKSKGTDKKLWPKFPRPPAEASQWQMQGKMRALSRIPLKYENPAYLDEALSVIPLNDVHREAEEESLLQQAQSLSLGQAERPQLGYQDCVIRALLRYALFYLQSCTLGSMTRWES